MYGRRMTLIGISIPFLVGFYLMALSHYVQWVPLLFIGRVITGLGTGASAPTAQVYVSECSSPRVRGALGSFTATALSLGILIAYIIGALVQWHVLCFILGSLPVVLGLAMMFMPETPSWLMSRQKEPEARVALQQLRGKHTDIEEEFARIKNKDVERQGQEAVRLFGALGASGGALMRPLVISLALMFFQKFSGINAVIFYSASIFQAAGSSVDRFVSSITIAIVQLVCTLLAALSVDRFGRRCLLLISGAFMAASLTGLAVYLHLTTSTAAAAAAAVSEEDQQLDESFDGSREQLMAQLGWIPLLCLMSFIVAYSAGFGAVPQLVMSELFPIEYRHQLSTVSTSFNLCCTFLVVRTFPDMSDAMGLAGVYALYATCSLAAVVFVFFALPETKGRTLEEISQLFSPYSPPANNNNDSSSAGINDGKLVCK